MTTTMRCGVLGALAVVALASPARALTAEESNTIAAHDKVANSVVLVVVRGLDPQADDPNRLTLVTGSGFAIEPGLVVTNYHVIETATSIDVVLSTGESERASIVGTAPGFDIALLAVSPDESRLPPAPLGTSVDLRVGQKVLACSHPLGLQHSMSMGIVSGLNRELPGLELGPSVIQFDAALNPGQSGGPLVDSDGRVVGVTAAKISAAESIGYAIPVDIVTRILPDLKAMGHPFRPQVGLQGIGVDPDLARLLDLPAERGFLVEGVDPGSVAESAGLTAGHRHVRVGRHEYVLGGDVIVAVNGLPVSGGDELNLRFLSARSGDTLAIAVVGPEGRRVLELPIPAMKH